MFSFFQEDNREILVEKAPRTVLIDWLVLVQVSANDVSEGKQEM